jgi:DNA-binding GntR family transcriptional regulator
MAPGSVIHQGSLAHAFGISITPLREALRRLEGEGLIEVRSDKTIAVVPLTTQELAELAAAIASGDQEIAERLTFCHLQASMGEAEGSMEQRFGASAWAAARHSG